MASESHDPVNEFGVPQVTASEQEALRLDGHCQIVALEKAVKFVEVFVWLLAFDRPTTAELFDDLAITP